ncbi:MAG: hypothetical protein IKO40_02275 [Kiritimatiellae bacterium]|nr:hypothetical protein [Kiritimatiellia bacterium]
MSNPVEIKAAARQFAEFWQGKGSEKGQARPFRLRLLRIPGVASTSETCQLAR